jgi:hypothetical protein
VIERNPVRLLTADGYRESAQSWKEMLRYEPKSGLIVCQ